MDNVEPIVNALGALADPGRLRMVAILAAVGEQSVGELARRLGVRAPAVSQALAILKLSGLVSSRRDGQRVLYRVATGWGVEAGWIVIRVPRGEVRLNLDAVER